MWLQLDHLLPKGPIEGTAFVSTTGCIETGWSGQERQSIETVASHTRIGKVTATVATEAISRITTTSMVGVVTTEEVIIRRGRGESIAARGDQENGTTCRLVTPINPRGRTIREVEERVEVTITAGCSRGLTVTLGVVADLGVVGGGVGGTHLLVGDTVS